MRIFGFFIKAILSIVSIVLFVYFIGSFLWLSAASGSFTKDIRALLRSVDDPITNARACANAPAASKFSKPKALQLRFSDDRNYTVELLCTLIESTPVEISRGVLPPFIRKAVGSSGLFIDLTNPEPSSVELAFLYARKSLTIDGKLLAAGQKPAAPLAVGVPASSCAGWGYRCCNATSERGTGHNQTQGVVDCPRDCYSACAPRPTIISLVADPYPTADNEVILTAPTMSVTFSYTAELAGGTIRTVTIDYGDGKTDSSSEPTGTFTHTYSCPGPCRMEAKVTALDPSGNSSLASDISTLYIKRM